MQVNLRGRNGTIMGRGADETGTTGKRGRILVVDGDADLLEMMLYALRHRGFEAEGAPDGLQALVLLGQKNFDVVLTDLRMPRLDGVGLLREIRRTVDSPTVVVQTSLLDPALELVLRRAGAFRVLRKGGPLAELLRSVEEAYQASQKSRTCCT